MNAVENENESIGLGRYGDNIDIYGTKKAVEELQRTLAKNGNLFFSVPIGKDSLYFIMLEKVQLGSCKRYLNYFVSQIIFMANVSSIYLICEGSGIEDGF